MLEHLTVKSFSSLEKIFIDENIELKKGIAELTAFKNQKVSYQVCLLKTLQNGEKATGGIYPKLYSVRLTGDLKDFATVSSVISIPSEYPCNVNHDSLYLRTNPGLFPDLIRPLNYNGGFNLVPGYTYTLWVDVKIPKRFKKGSYNLTLEIYSPDSNTVYASNTMKINVENVELPPQKLIHTEWFYTDCIANYYGVKAFSQKHWKFIKNFIKTAVENGINMILTPVFTPELDTYIGGERLTTQLLDIFVDSKGNYTFGFEKLSKWIYMCKSLGVKYFEMPHMFSQWGAAHAPKIVAKVNGKEEKIFGWETDATGDEYVKFLSSMIPALVDFLKEKGVFERTYFHVSDEPHLEHLEQYMRCKKFISPYVDDEHIIDALSNYDFYESGALKKPVPAIKHIDEFLKNNVQNLWAYYCGDSGYKISGRQLAMPLYRTRILGIQLWLNKIEGFLHWGYNYYNNQNSYDALDPFLYSDGEYFAPSGDSYLVYPGKDGEALPSLRLNALKDAMEDMRLLDLCESHVGRERTVEIIKEAAKMDITFTKYPQNAEFFEELKEKIISAIK